jgi:GR25 family glycosyltransferase involved in LPS biosynthesis
MQSFTCYLINLDKDKDRLAFMDEQLTKTNITYTRIQAVYGKELSSDERKKYYNEEAKGEHRLNDGELGCALSHRKALEETVQKKEGYALVLEDDVALPENFKDILEREIKKNKQNSQWDYVSFDYFAYGLPFIKLWLPGIHTIIKNKKGMLSKSVCILSSFLKCIPLCLLLLAEEIQKNLYKNRTITPLKPTSFAGAYLLTYDGAQKILSVSDTILYIADRLPIVAKQQKSLRFKIYTPLVVRQLKHVFSSNLHSIK